MGRKRRFPGRKTSVCKEWRPDRTWEQESYLVGLEDSRVKDNPFFGFSNWTDGNTTYYIGNAQGGEIC